MILEDLPTDEHLRLFAGNDICLAPSRWEGLGLHLYEAMALGLPVITNDDPPMNEVIRDGENGLLVALAPRAAARSRGSRPRSRSFATSPGRSRRVASRGRSRRLQDGVADGARAARLAAHARRPRGADRSGPALSGEHLLEREQRLPTAPEDTFEFFGDAHNLEAITPPLARLPRPHRAPDRDRSGSADRVPASPPRDPAALADPDRDVGATASLRRRQIRGPYALWHHTHEFEPSDGGGTLMAIGSATGSASGRPANSRGGRWSTATSSGSSTTGATRSSPCSSAGPDVERPHRPVEAAAQLLERAAVGSPPGSANATSSAAVEPQLVGRRLHRVAVADPSERVDLRRAPGPPSRRRGRRPTRVAPCRRRRPSGRGATASPARGRAPRAARRGSAARLPAASRRSISAIAAASSSAAKAITSRRKRSSGRAGDLDLGVVARRGGEPEEDGDGDRADREAELRADSGERRGARQDQGATTNGSDQDGKRHRRQPSHSRLPTRSRSIRA